MFDAMLPVEFKNWGSLTNTPAHKAQPADVLAQEAFKQGQIQYNLGRFEKALEHFSKAYETMPHGAFLFNIGQCHRQLNDHKKAIFFFEGYLRALPTAPNRQEVEDLITEHSAKLSIEKARSKKAKTKTKKPKKKKRATPPKTKKATSAPVTAPPKEPVASPEGGEAIASPTTESWVLWTIIGCVGVIGTGIGLIAVINRTNSSNDTSNIDDNTLGEYDLSK